MLRPLLVLLILPITVFGQSWKEFPVTDSTQARVLKGTLLVPDVKKKKRPVVLIIAGSGPTDRNGNSPGLKSDYLKLLAEGLAQNGIASLRFDKRGIGQSKITNKNEEAVVFDDFVQDAASWVNQLRLDKRFNKVIIAGHSEGSLIGMLVASQQKTNAYISLAGAGRPIDLVLKEQLKANPNNPEPLMRSANDIIDSLRMGYRAKNVNMLLMGLFRPSVQPFLISWMKYDPAQEIKKLAMPVMIVQGTTDIQVSMTDAEALHQAAPKATYVVVEGMNHVFRDAPADRAANVALYMQPEKPLSASLLPKMIDFVNGLKK